MPRLQAPILGAANDGNKFVSAHSIGTVQSSPDTPPRSSDRLFILTSIEEGEDTSQQMDVTSDEKFIQQKLTEMSSSESELQESGFAGFPSPGVILHHVTPQSSEINLDQSAKPVYNMPKNAMVEDQCIIEQIVKKKKHSYSSESIVAATEVSENPKVQLKSQHWQKRRQPENASSSELPISSPTNTRCAKQYAKRPPLLKNTLPVTVFERNLALISKQNPQMSVTEKIDNWQCAIEPCIVEDVHDFDERFKAREEKSMKMASEQNKLTKTTQTDAETFSQFQTRMKYIEQCRKDTYEMLFHRKKRAKAHPVETAITSHGKQRRPDTNTVNTNASTCNSNSIKSRNLAMRYMKFKRKSAQARERSTSIEDNVRVNIIDTIMETEKQLPTKGKQYFMQHSRSDVLNGISHNIKTNVNTSQKEHARKHHQFREGQSSIIPKRLNGGGIVKKRFLDSDIVPVSEHQSLIQMRLDFLSDKKNTLKEKVKELFKTPTVPQKYLPSVSPPAPTSQEKQLLQHQPQSDISTSNTDSPTDMNDTSMTPSSDSGNSFHQQHEFCNYLGLTGMSTANAVANAVAELAKCNVNRRSLRVQRLQQQQEKREKNARNERNKQIAKDEENKQLEQLKQKQLRELHRQVYPEGNMELDEDTFNNAAIERNFLKYPRDPEIKILCHIPNTTKEDAIIASRHCAKRLVEPIRRTLLRRLKQQDLPGVECDRSTTPSSCVHTLRSDDEKQWWRAQAEVQQSPKLFNDMKSQPLRDSSQTRMEQRTNMNRAQVEQLHERFQKCLADSRKVKPSIYIVKSLASHEMISNSSSDVNRPQGNVEAMASVAAPPTTVGAATVKPAAKGNSTATFVKAHKLGKSRKSQERLSRSQGRLKKLISRSSLNARQLRNRKIFIVKAKRNSKTSLQEQPALKVDKSTFTCDKLNLEQNTTNDPLPVKLNTPSPSEKMKMIFNTVNDTTDEHMQHNKATPNCSMNSAKGNLSPIQRELDETLIYYAPSERGKDALHMPTNSEAVCRTLTQENIGDNDNVVVSSTTSTFDENMLNTLNNNQTRTNESVITEEIYKNTAYFDETFESHANKVDASMEHLPIAAELPPPAVSVAASSQTSEQQQHTRELSTQDSATQCYLTRCTGGLECGQSIQYLTAPSKPLQNPLKYEDGGVLYIYYELEILIAVQEWQVSFWKYSKLLNVLANGPTKPSVLSLTSANGCSGGSSCGREEQNETASSDMGGEWSQLGSCRRSFHDIELDSPYSNRICMHNSTPIYIEMRCRELTKERRDCNLLSMYINVYYYNEDDLRTHKHSIQLDSVQSLPKNVIYTTIPESRYFIMSWPQENALGKVRSGLCKYSLTPQLDTLASIREFKSMRHELLYLECTVDDKLLGFGYSQVTIWDHRSGDVLMNYDMEVPLGRNLGSIYYPSMEIGQNSMVLLFQYIRDEEQVDLSGPPELLVIACNVSHTSPSHRVLQRHQLPQPAFNAIKSSTNTGEHLVITTESDEEIWISCANPNMITCVAPQNTLRYYTRGHTQLIELTEKTLTIDTFANHILKLAAKNKPSTYSKAELPADK